MYRLKDDVKKLLNEAVKLEFENNFNLHETVRDITKIKAADDLREKARVIMQIRIDNLNKKDKFVAVVKNSTIGINRVVRESKNSTSYEVLNIQVESVENFEMLPYSYVMGNPVSKNVAKLVISRML